MGFVIIRGNHLAMDVTLHSQQLSTYTSNNSLNSITSRLDYAKRHNIVLVNDAVYSVHLQGSKMVPRQTLLRNILQTDTCIALLKVQCSPQLLQVTALVDLEVRRLAAALRRDRVQVNDAVKIEMVQTKLFRAKEKFGFNTISVILLVYP